MEKPKYRNYDAISYVVMFILFINTVFPIIDLMLFYDYEQNDYRYVILFYILFLVFAPVAGILQTAIHEAGHLVMGLLTGYRFVSYRLLNLMVLCDEEGRLKFKKLSIAGTLGQCLMDPPEDDGKYPCFLYNAGGILFNVVASLIAVIVMIFVKTIWIRIFLGIFAIMGLSEAYMNGVPLQTNMAPNDGMNLLEMTRHPSSREAFYLQMTANRLLMKGTRFRDMPDEILEIDDEVLSNGSIGASVLVFQENRCMDALDFDGAYELIEKGRKNNYPFAGMHLYSLLLDRATIDCLKGCATEITDKNLLKYMKIARNLPNVLRTRYGIALTQNDTQQQEAIVAEMEKLRDSYPYSVDLQSERDIMDALKKAIRPDEQPDSEEN